MQSKSDRIEMSLFVTRYICTLFIFVLGLKAPGITSIAGEDEELLVDNENNVSINEMILSTLNYIMLDFRTTNQPSEMAGRRCAR